ncbi:MAG: ATP-binding protein [Candidatus Omnitrophota bacterium]
MPIRSKPQEKLKKPAAKANQQQLAEQYQLLKDLMDCIPDVIYFKDRRGRFLLVNKAHAKGLGLSPEKVAGKTDFDIHPKERAKLMSKDDEYVMSTGKPIIDKIERSTRADGVDNYVSTTKIPRYDDKGNITGLVGITRDITQRMQLAHLRQERDAFKKKLSASEEINKMKSELVSVVSHELRTPLAIIKEGISLVLDGIKGAVNDEQKRVLLSVQNNTERLRKIIEELLDVSRIEKGRLKLHYSLANLSELIKESAEHYKKITQEKGLVLDYKLPRQEVNIFIDAERVIQVISNLLDNAVKFTEQGGKITIELKIIGDRVRAAVIDTGIGIPKRGLDKIFNKFTQVSKDSAGKNKGIGLGLFIIKELVTSHGGEAWAESKPGIGSKFYFTLPLFYTSAVLDAKIKGKINELLKYSPSLYLVDLLIINFDEFRRTIRLGRRKLYGNLKAIIGNVLTALIKGKSGLFTTEFFRGKIRIILPDVSEKQILELCVLLKNKLNAYFEEKRLKNIFVNLGIRDFPQGDKEPEARKFSVNIRIKKINVGLEERRFQRFKYQTDVGVFSGQKWLKAAQSVDISQRGLCFITKARLTTDAKIRVKLNIPGRKEPLDLSGRIAWIKEMVTAGSKGRSNYQIGMEFIRLGRKNKEAISKFIRALI